MSRINLLDCTLRDGGYVNDWHFGRDAIFNIGKKIVLAGIEYFEIGFVRECEYSKDYSLFDGNDSVRDMIAPKNPDTHYVGMIDMGRPIPLEKLGKRVPDGFDVFRVIFKKSKIEEAYNYIQELEKLGYDVFAQAVGTDNYTDSEFIALIEKFNRLPIKAFYIVDSFGLIKNFLYGLHPSVQLILILIICDRVQFDRSAVFCLSNLIQSRLNLGYRLCGGIFIGRHPKSERHR